MQDNGKHRILKALIAARVTEIFLLKTPTVNALPILANLPHSGLWIPESIYHQLNSAHQAFLPNQDWHLDQLYDFLPDLGITTLQATHSRYVVDLNRALKAPYFGSFWRAIVPAQTAFKVPIYDTAPSPSAVKQRLRDYYVPYHRQLTDQLNRLIQKFGQVYLLDLHSFYGLITDNVCLGNANGATCSASLIDSVERAFADQGYGVVRNKVFTGGHITQRYGRLPQIEALQIEVRYSVYLNQTHLDKPVIPNWQVPEFFLAKQKFKGVFEQIISSLNPRVSDRLG